CLGFVQKASPFHTCHSVSLCNVIAEASNLSPIPGCSLVDHSNSPDVRSARDLSPRTKSKEAMLRDTYGLFRQKVPGRVADTVVLMQDGGIPDHPPQSVQIDSRFPWASVPYGSLFAVLSPVQNLPFLRTEYDISGKA